MLLYRDYLIFTQFPDLGGWRELESGANELQVGASLVIQTMSAIFLPRSRSFNQKLFYIFKTQIKMNSLFHTPGGTRTRNPRLSSIIRRPKPYPLGHRSCIFRNNCVGSCQLSCYPEVNTANCLAP